ncbi:unnamed protein product [Rhizophagus irregularis]|nr:unnamed protein product [Rhizophagus irregularis]
MEIYEITFEEKTPLYHSSQEIFSEETEEDLDTSFDELFDDENEEEFGTYEDQEVPPPPVEDANEPVYRLNPAMYTNFSPCILIDYLDNKLQTCGQTKNVRNLCQLVEVWQIDENAVSEYQSKGIPLGVLKLAVDVAYCVLKIFISLAVELDVKIIYGKCGENISKFHVSGKRKTTCEQHKLHKEDTSKSLKLLAQWLTYVADTETEEKKK